MTFFFYLFLANCDIVAYQSVKKYKKKSPFEGWIITQKRSWHNCQPTRAELGKNEEEEEYFVFYIISYSLLSGYFPYLMINILYMQ